MKVLLVWEIVPEKTSFYLLEGEAADKAVKAHGCYVNGIDSDPDKAAEELINLLSNHAPLDIDSPIKVIDLDAVVISGFIQ